MKLPNHINLHIEHQPHAANYETVEEWLLYNESEPATRFADYPAEDRAAMLAAGEIWTVQWYPNTPVGFCCVAAATLERALELANEDDNDSGSPR